MIKSGTIKEIKQLATGVGRGNKTWTLTKIVFNDGFDCTTFDNIYEVGQEVNLSVEQTSRKDKNGVLREGWQVVPSKPKKESVVAQNAKFEEVVGMLGEILAIVTGIDTKVEALVRKEEKIDSEFYRKEKVGGLPF